MNGDTHGVHTFSIHTHSLLFMLGRQTATPLFHTKQRPYLLHQIPDTLLCASYTDLRLRGFLGRAGPARGA